MSEGDPCPASPTCSEANTIEQRLRANGQIVARKPQHGTTSGYKHLRCHKGSPCPATPSCFEVMQAYQQQWRAGRTANA